MGVVMLQQLTHRVLLATAFLLTLSIPLKAAEESVDSVFVRLSTNFGDIVLELFPDKAPVTVDNFLGYVDSGHYDGTVFHRVINNFMIQGGGFTEQLVEKKTGEPIVNESRNRLHNVRGTVAMARTGEPDSATAQFFINHRNNLRLDWAPGREGYTVFGKVVDGMGVVDFIATAKTGVANAVTSRGPSPFSDVPVDPVLIVKANRVNAP